MTTASDDGVTTLRCPDHGIDHNDDDGWHDGSACQHAWKQLESKDAEIAQLRAQIERSARYRVPEADYDWLMEGDGDA